MSPKIEYAATDKYHVFRLRGDVRYGDVVTLQEFIEKIKAKASPFIIDLTETKHLDSTALGTLALIAKYSRENNVSKPTLYVIDPVVIETLMGVCFDLVFDIQTEFPPPEAKNFKKVEAKSLSVEELSKTVKQAHKTLAEISGANEDLFKDVNRLLES